MELSQSSDHNMSNKMPKQEMYFTIDVMTNILNRLPSTSILRFQTVSKYWCYAILDILNARSKSSLMSIQLSTNVDSRKLTFINFDDEGKAKTSIRNISLGSTSNYNFSNMVNGLACAYGNKTTTTFYLINLTTFETSKYLKRIESDAISDDNITLGFDPSTGLYKFIRIYYHCRYGSYHCEILEIGVLFKGNWKIIGKVPDRVELDNPVFLNGAIHWRMNSWSSNTGKSLAFDFLKLDMKEEKFEMVTPILQNESDVCDCQVCSMVYDFTLTEENGKLYVLHYCCRRKYLDGWRLKESKRYHVWNVVFHVNFASMINKEPRCLLDYAQMPYVVGIVDGKVLIRSREYKGVYIYDLLHKKLSKHLNVYCGSSPLERGFRRMFFNLRDVFSKRACSK